MVISRKYEALSDINYNNNYNKIFENNNLELNGQISPINKLNTELDSKSSSETNYGDKINKLFQNDGLFKNIFSHQSNNILSMVNFNILQSSSTLFSSGQDYFFLTSIIN